MSADRPPPHRPGEPWERHAPSLGDVCRVYIGASGWAPAFIVGIEGGKLKLLIDASRRSTTFSDAFAAGFDSNGLIWLDVHSVRLRRTGRKISG